MKKIITITIALLLLAVAAQAQIFQPEGADFELKPTRFGMSFDAKGALAVWESRDYTSPGINFAVRAGAQLPDGTVLVVSCSNRRGEIKDIGSISLSVGSGILRLNSASDRDSPVFPLENLRDVQVSVRGEVILYSEVLSFPSPDRE